MGIEPTSEFKKAKIACFHTSCLTQSFNPSSNPKSGRLARTYKYLAVPGGLVSCCKYLLSRQRPRVRVHSFQSSYIDSSQTIEDAKRPR